MPLGIVNGAIFGGPNSGVTMTHHCVKISANTANTFSFPIPASSQPARATSIIINGLATETFELLLSQDNGTSYSAAIIPYVTSTGLLNSTALLADGIYFLPKEWVFDTIKLTKSAGTDVAAVSIAKVDFPK